MFSSRSVENFSENCKSEFLTTDSTDNTDRKKGFLIRVIRAIRGSITRCETSIMAMPYATATWEFARDF